MLLKFGGREYTGADGETVLECLERHGEAVSSFCRAGVCQSCLLRAVEGDIPAAAQNGLKDAWKRQGYFLACVCRPEGPLKISRCDGVESFATQVASVAFLTPRVLKVQVRRPSGFRYESGQFIQLVRPGDQLMRPYSLASLSDAAELELHVAILPEGQMSSWLATAAGQDVVIRGPLGECCYFPDEPDRVLLLAGTGTGLSPLLGVARAALAAGHRAPIKLVHGVSRPEGLYFWRELLALQRAHAQLEIVGSVLTGANTIAVPAGAPTVLTDRSLEELLLADTAALADARVYLCGNPDLVRNLRKKIYLAGASLARIHFDPFVPPATPAVAARTNA